MLTKHHKNPLVTFVKSKAFYKQRKSPDIYYIKY